MDGYSGGVVGEQHRIPFGDEEYETKDFSGFRLPLASSHNTHPPHHPSIPQSGIRFGKTR